MSNFCYSWVLPIKSFWIFFVFIVSFFRFISTLEPGKRKYPVLLIQGDILNMYRNTRKHSYWDLFTELSQCKVQGQQGFICTHKFQEPFFILRWFIPWPDMSLSWPESILTRVHPYQRPSWPESVLTRVHLDQSSSWSESILIRVHSDQGPSWPDSILTRVYPVQCPSWLESILISVHPD